MDGTHFDRLTKLMARNATSRRETIRWLVGTALGRALAASGAHWATGGAAAACKPVGGKCKQSRNCCDGEICGKNGRCKCAPGRKDCDGDKRCETDITGDDDNCGACGNACPDGQVCRDGQCECRFGGPLCGGECCFDGETCCDGLCRDLDEDAGACGSLRPALQRQPDLRSRRLLHPRRRQRLHRQPRLLQLPRPDDLRRRRDLRAAPLRGRQRDEERRRQLL